MQELLVIGNPARRRKSRKARSPAQRAATRRLVALNKTRRNPAKRRAAPSTTVAAPKRRRTARRAVARTRRSVRRVASGLNMGNVMAQLKSAGIGASGAIAIDAVFGFAQSYLPAAIATETDTTGGVNYGYYAAKAATAIGVAMLAKKVLPANLVAHGAAGSLTVTAHDMLKRIMVANMPSMTLGKYTGGSTAPVAASLRGVPGGLTVGVMPRMTPDNGMGLGKYVGRNSNLSMYVGNAASRESAVR